MSLRQRVLQGGAYLALREVIGIGVRLGGIVALTAILGPAEFGLYAGPAALVTFLGVVAQFGVEVFLIRRQEEPSEALYQEAFSFLVVTTGAIGGLALAISFAVEAVTGPTEALAPFRVLLVGLVLNVLWAPAQARLERAFRFRAMALLELGGDLALYLPAVALAVAGAGFWAPVAGYLVWQGFLLAASYRLARFRPRWRFSRAGARGFFAFGLSFSSATWLERAREIVNPLVIGPLLGSAAVGVVALAIRLGETLSFVMRATWRVSIAALGRLQDDAGRLRSAFEEAITLQILAGGSLLAAFSAVADPLVPLVFGADWDEVLELLPFVATSYLVMSAFALHSALLYVLQRNASIVWVNAARLAVLAGVTAMLVPGLGIQGYGIALLVAQLGYVGLHRQARRAVGYRFRGAVPWLATLAPPMFAPLVGWPEAAALYLPLLVLLSTRAARAQLGGYVTMLRGAVLKRGAA